MAQSQRVPVIQSGQTLLSSSYNHTFFNHKEPKRQHLESVLSVSFGPAKQGQHTNFKRNNQIHRSFQEALISNNPYNNCPRILAQSSATRRSLNIVSSVLRSNQSLQSQYKEHQQQRFQQRLYQSLDAGYVKYKEDKDKKVRKVTQLSLGYELPITITAFENCRYSLQQPSPIVKHNLGLIIDRQKHNSSVKTSSRYQHCGEILPQQNQFHQAFKAYNDSTGNNNLLTIPTRNMNLNDFKQSIATPTVPSSDDLPRKVKQNLNIVRSFQYPCSSSQMRTIESSSPYNHAGDSGGTRSHRNEHINHQSIEHRTSASSSLLRQKTPLELIKQANTHYKEDQMILAESDDKPKYLKKIKQILLTNKFDSRDKQALHIRFAKPKLAVNGNSKQMSKQGTVVARRNSVLRDSAQQTDDDTTNRFHKLINFNIDGIIQKLANRINANQTQVPNRKNVEKGVRFSDQKDIIIISDSQ